MTPTITRLRPRFMMNHILSSPPEIHPQSGKQLTFFLLCEGREHLKIWKGQASRTYTSGDVSNSFYGSRLGQQWEFYIRAGLDYKQWWCVCVSVCLARRIPNDLVVQHLWNTTQGQCLLLLIFYQVRFISLFLPFSTTLFLESVFPCVSDCCDVDQKEVFSASLLPQQLVSWIIY